MSEESRLPDLSIDQMADYFAATKAAHEKELEAFLDWWAEQGRPFQTRVLAIAMEADPEIYIDQFGYQPSECFYRHAKRRADASK